MAKAPPEKPPAKSTAVNVGGLVKGQYEVVSILGHGGFGTVFKVRDKKTKQHYALKVNCFLFSYI